MVFGRFVKEKEDLQMVQAICEDVFMKEIGLTDTGVKPDAFALSAIAYDGETPAGVGRLLFDGEHFTIMDVAVLPAYRHQKYGDFIVRLLIDKAMMANAQKISLDALQGTEAFFKGIGFAPQGEAFESLGGRWQPMVLLTDQIHKCSGCC